MNLRNSPRFSDRSSRNEPNGKRLEFDAWTYGETGTDMWTGQPDNRWFKVKGTNLWVPSAYIYGNPPNSSLIPGGTNTGTIPGNGYSPIPGVIPPPIVSIKSISNADNSSTNVVRGKSIRVSGNSNTTDMKFYVVNGQGERQVGGTLDYLTDGTFTARLNLPNDMLLGNYAVKIAAKNQPGLTNTFYSSSTINVVDNDKVQQYIGKTKGGTDRHIVFERVNSRGYIENRPTWIVIHGWNGNAENSKDLAKAIEEYDGYQVGDQVLTLDWDAARTGKTSLNAAATWIETVAEYTKNVIQSWGILSSNINLVGHSLGAYVAYEVSKRLNGIGKLVALDPATTTFNGYTGKGSVNFSSYSQWSWGFYSSWFGSEDRAKTAHESFYVEFPWANDDERHGAVRDLWANMLRDKNGSISQYFGLEDMNSSGKPWHIDSWGNGSGWEAQIKAKDKANWVPDSWWEL
ncbi:hypothetical protein QM565_00205 [Geitlerinema splendidum]|nr:hypothetical protein [Geitlerinema splendidum]